MEFTVYLGDYFLKDLLTPASAMNLDMKMKVSSLITQGQWNISEPLSHIINSADLPVITGYEDKLLWTGHLSGTLTAKEAYNRVRSKKPIQSCYKQIWKSWVHSSLSGNTWKLMHNACATDENLQKRGICLVSQCYFCHQNVDTIDHILWQCSSTIFIWNWLSYIFNCRIPKNFSEFFAIKHCSPFIKQAWLVAGFILITEVWFSSARFTGTSSGSPTELQVLTVFGFHYARRKTIRIILIQFSLPPPPLYLICCDGASKKNPGQAGYGFLCRHHSGRFVFGESGGLGITTNYVAEVIAFVTALERAVQKGIMHILLQSDSSSVLQALKSKQFPWYIQSRWIVVSGKIAKRGVNLQPGQTQ